MKLNEISRPHHILTDDQRAWLKRCKGHQDCIFDTQTGLVDNIDGSVTIPIDTTTIPVQFGEVNSFTCINCPQLISLRGSPLKCGYFTCSGSTALHSLQGAPKESNSFHANNCPGITNLKGIEKEQLTVTDCIWIPSTVKSHIFGLVFCNIECIDILNSYKQARQAVRIINRCLSGQITKIMCQKELIEAGLGEFARM